MKNRRSAGNLVLSTRRIVGTLAAGGLACMAGTNPSRRSNGIAERAAQGLRSRTARQSSCLRDRPHERLQGKILTCSMSMLALRPRTDDNPTISFELHTERVLYR